MSVVWMLSLLSSLALNHAEERFCRFKDFDHYYVKYDKYGTESLIKHKNYLPSTPVHEFALLTDLCLDENGLPEVVRCLGNQQWEERGSVICQAEVSETSKFLNKMQLEMNDPIGTRMGLSSSKIIENICTKIGKQQHAIIPADVVNLDLFVKAVARDGVQEAVGTEMIDLYSLLMATNDSVLQRSARLNATNSLLFHFENYMNDLARKLFIGEQGVRVFAGERLSVFFVYPELSQYTGIAIYSKAGTDRLGCQVHGFCYRLLYANQSLDELKQERDLQAATFLTDELWQAVHTTDVTCLVFKVYGSDALFVDTGVGTGSPSSYVLSINIPGRSNHSLPYALAFALHNENYGKQQTYSAHTEYCGYWDYGTWNSYGVTTDSSDTFHDRAVVCHTTHLTQFAFLVGGSCLQQECSRTMSTSEIMRNERLLDSITAVGCALSLLGLAGIWLTAAISSRWRSLASIKLLLNLCLAMSLLFLLMLLMYVNEWLWRFVPVQHSIECIALGSLLQFAVLLLFSWMLVIGYLQYRRHVTVFAVSSQHCVMKAVVIAWTLPLLPTVLLLLLDSSSYRPLVQALDSNALSTLCYPSGKGLAYAVVWPIGLVLLANTVTLVCIFYRICQIRHRQGIILLQVRLFILLFFLLGLTWIFGICTYFCWGVMFSVLFCVTATIQGFVLFVFFVVFNEVARQAWRQLFAGYQSSVSF